MTSKFPDLARYDRAAIDTETTGVTRSDRPVGLSWALPDGSSGYLRWGHERGGNNCTAAEVREWAGVELPRTRVVMHNSPFDLRMIHYENLLSLDAIDKLDLHDTLVICGLVNILEPSFALDALAMEHAGIRKLNDAELNSWCAREFGGKATHKQQIKNYWRAPGDMVAPYARQDATATLGLFDTRMGEIDALGIADLYETEMALVPILLRMHSVGTRVDRAKCMEVQAVLRGKLESTKAQWLSVVGDVNYNSTQQLARVFDKEVLSYSKTEKGQPSITKDVEFKRYADHEIVQLITRMRRLEKFSGTFIESYLLNNLDDDDLVHGQFHAMRSSHGGTTTGRFSSSDPLNWQNFPARDKEFAKVIRGLCVAYTPDYSWVKADYSQIEYRFFAHFAGGAMRRAYIDDPDMDFHDMVAAMASIDRRPAKTINFGLLYGMGVKLLATQLGLPIDEAKTLMALYHQRVPAVKRTSNRASRAARSKGYVRTWGGRYQRFISYEDAERMGWDLKYDKPGQFVGGHKALNYVLQGSAADLIKKAMVAVCRAGIVDWSSVLLHLTVHDELDLSVANDVLPQKTKALREVMEDFKLRVPIKVDIEVGRDWGNVRSLDAA